MTGTGRALLGAAVGALLTLVIHPLSRPFLTSVFIRQAPAALDYYSRFEGTNQKRLPSPQSQEERSVWMQSAADRLKARVPLSKTELESVLSVAEAGAKEQPDNAYWKQMMAVMLHGLGRDDEARATWIRAAKCSTWNDLESVRLMHLRATMAATTGVPQSWQLSYVLLCRTTSSALAIEAFARWILAGADLESEPGLALRYATFVNGNLIRAGARSLDTGNEGSTMVELASHPTELRTSTSVKKLLLARLYFQRRLHEVGHDAWALEVGKGYGSNDGWVALTQNEDTQAHRDEMLFASLLTASIPSLLLALSIAGGVLWTLGSVLALYTSGKAHLRFATAAALGGSAGVGVYLITLLPLAGAVTLLCFLFLVYSPKNERKIREESLGPLFDFILIVIGLAFGAVFGAFLAGMSIPVVSVLEVLGLPREYYGGSSLFAGLSAILLATLLLVAPTWAIAQRIGTPYVLSVMFKRFGAIMGLSTLALCVLVTPLAVYFDRSVSDTLEKLVENEPIYYLIRAR